MWKLKWELKEDVMLIVVSDVHIGAKVNHQIAFIQFLNHLIANIKNKKLEALIILGDFFDVIMESIRDYCRVKPYSGLINSIKEKTQNYDIIFSLLEKLSKSVKIFFTLGNHEITILGNLDKHFFNRKTKFRQKFEKNNFKYLQLLNLDNIYQYFILSVLSIGNKKKWVPRQMF